MSGNVSRTETKCIKHSKSSILVRELPADLETPVSAFLKLEDSGACVLLESVDKANSVGRYSFIGTKPERIWEGSGIHNRAILCYTSLNARKVQEGSSFRYVRVL